MMASKLGAGVSGPGDPRPEVVESWRRCEAVGLDHDSTPPFIGEVDPRGRLMQAARPVLDELAGLLEGVRVALVLTDDRVQVLEAQFVAPELAPVFEARHGTPGYSWAEEHVGTTAIALAVQHRAPTMVRGAEHYRPTDRDITAAAAPILDPFTREVVGALDLTGPVVDASGHMFAAVAQAARAISQRLCEQESPSQHRLLARFLAEQRRDVAGPVFVVNERMVISNASATHLLHEVDRRTLWEQALDTAAAMRGVGATNLLTLRDGRSLTAYFEKTDPLSVRAGVLVRVEGTPAFMATTQPLRSRVGDTRTRSARYLQEEVSRVAAATGAILVVGEPGSGKLSVAEEIHRHANLGQLAVVDGAKDLLGEADALLRDIAAASTEPDTTLIIRHAECLGMPAVTLLRTLVSAGAPARIVATMNIDPHRPDRHDLDDLFPHRVHVPPLRDRLDELPELVAKLMRRHGATGQMQPAAVEALARHEWPGNMRELHATIKGVVASRRTCDITVRDLPQLFSASQRPRKLTRIEHLERAAIRQALIEARGNRTRAAEILQIGRATLYRKMKSFGLESGPEAEG